MADPIRHSPTAGLRVCNRVFGRGPTTRAVDWSSRFNPGRFLSVEHSRRARFAHRRNVAFADVVLVRVHRPGNVDLRLGRIRAFADRSGRLRKRNFIGRPLGDVHVNRSHRPDLVRLRLGNSAARNRLLVHLSLSVTRWAAISEFSAADFGLLALPLARLSNHGRRGSD